MNRHEKLLLEAYRLATDVTPVGNARVAAILVKQNQILSYGINRSKTNPFAAKFGKNSQAIMLHAETDAIRNALKKTIDISEIEGSTMYVARARKISTHNHSYTFAMAKPCEGCQRALALYGIKRVYHTADDQFIKEY